MSDDAILKYCPADFLVKESLVVPLTDRGAADLHYLMLRKQGYTTMEAVRLIADALGVETRNVTYGGLKDEDGISEQLVAVPVGAVSGQLDGEGWPLADGESQWVRLEHYGYGTEPLRIGGLEGNGFRVVVRNLDEEQAGRLEQRRKVNLLFLNYYDTQRFGVPGQPKRTHLVGAAMLANRWEEALDELIGLCAPESAAARRWWGAPRDFFTGLDPRTASFYLAAHASADWNRRLRAIVSTSCPQDWHAVELEGLQYYYLAPAALAVKVLGAVPELPYDRYTFEGGEPQLRVSMRPTVVQTTVTISAREDDNLIPGRFRVSLGFFLPSGSYATAAIRQLLLDS